MTAILSNSVFLHIPKTGGVWVRDVLKQNDLYLRNIRVSNKKYTTNNPGSWHNVPWDDADFIARPHRFGFVRHPLTWYRSYWAFKMRRGNWDTTDFDFKCKANTFIKFVDNIIRYYPDGYLTNLYSFYTSHCTFVGRQEQLAVDLQYIVFEYEDVKITDFPDRVNYSSNDILAQALYTPSQMKQIMWIEREINNKYDYN
jgi:hypothetical protein